MTMSLSVSINTVIICRPGVPPDGKLSPLPAAALKRLASEPIRSHPSRTCNHLYLYLYQMISDAKHVNYSLDRFITLSKRSKFPFALEF